MAEVNIEETPKKIRDVFNKGLGAFERGNLDYAIGLLTSCIEMEPGLLQARKFLRAAEVSKYKQKKVNHTVSMIIGMPRYLSAQTLVAAGKGEKAVLTAEKLLKIDPLNLKFIFTFADAAELADLPEAAVQTLLIAHEHYPDDTNVIRRMADLYDLMGETRSARDFYEKLAELCPRDPEAIKLLKDAMAKDSMKSDGWAEAQKEGHDYRSLIKNAKEAELLEQQSKAVKTDKDIEALIKETLSKIEAEPENINYYRALSRLYVQNRQFDEAVEVLKKALEINPGDPELDNALSNVQTAHYDALIAHYNEVGDEVNSIDMQNQKAQFVFTNLQDRVTRYPNDLELRYLWGELLFKNDYIKEATEQFQLAQRNPMRRVRALYYLGLCFKHNGQFDMSLDQFKLAAENLTSMDDTKKDIYYEIGEVLECMGDVQGAANYYKQIYQVDINYRDIAEKIEKVYRKN